MVGSVELDFTVIRPKCILCSEALDELSSSHSILQEGGSQEGTNEDRKEVALQTHTLRQ